MVFYRLNLEVTEGQELGGVSVQFGCFLHGEVSGVFRVLIMDHESGRAIKVELIDASVGVD